MSVRLSFPHVQNGVTPFLIAAAIGHIEVAGFLLDNGSSILEQTDVSDHQLLDLFEQGIAWNAPTAYLLR